MRTIEDLRHTFIEHETLAHGADGIIEAVQDGAVALRRRRRMVVSITAALLVAVVGLTPAMVTRMLRPPGSTAAASAYRGPYQMTVSLAPTSGYSTIRYGTRAHSQYLLLGRDSTNPDQSAPVQPSVVVYDPGSYDASALLAGQHVAVDGHAAYFAEKALLGSVSSTQEGPRDPDYFAPAVGWPDSHGAWVVVAWSYPATAGNAARDALLTVADLVRLGPARDLRVPFHFGYLPGALPNASVEQTNLGGNTMYLGATPPATLPNSPYVGNTVMISVIPGRVDGVRFFGAGTMIDGYEVWYFDNNDALKGYVKLGPVGSEMWANVGKNCLLEFTVYDKTKVPYDQLVAMLDQATFANCDDERTWLTPLG
jgi:hypothetical protein